MAESFLKSGSLAMDLLIAAGTLAAFIIGIVLVRLFWVRVLGPLVRRTDTELDDIILLPVRRLVLWGLFMLGFHLSVSSLDIIQSNITIAKTIGRVLGAGWAVLALWTILNLFNGIVSWYARISAERSDTATDISHQASLVRKGGNVLIFALGLLYILRTAGLDISPLLAGGAIGGLAIALALQDTLSNLFAGFYLTIDRPMKAGDFIKLESGDEGFVEKIGWRNTTVRLLANNVVVIPNSKLSQSVITNFFLPEQEMSVYVGCGVSYASDLQYVEDVTIEVAVQVMGEIEGTSSEWQPIVLWKEFGDSAITFVTVMRVKEFGVQYKLQSEFIKALHRRFNQEGIEIPFPIRTVIMKNASEDHRGLEESHPRSIRKITGLVGSEDEGG